LLPSRGQTRRQQFEHEAQQRVQVGYLKK